MPPPVTAHANARAIDPNLLLLLLLLLTRHTWLSQE
jgi:hypothetical protein